MTLDVKMEIDKVREMYKASSVRKSYNALIYGDIGTGKTQIVKTGRRPIFHYSFDPGGSRTIRDEIEEGWIISDTRWEYDDPLNPTVWRDWKAEYTRLRDAGFFANFGTLAVDSLTMLAQACMNYVLARAGRPGGIPMTGKDTKNDYVVSQSILEPMVKQLLGLPCDLILTAHPDIDKDEDTGRVLRVTPSVTGKLKLRLPLMFDEVYYARVKEGKEGPIYNLMTRTDGIYNARTRLGRNGVFEFYEKPNLKALLKKAGYPTDDLKTT